MALALSIVLGVLSFLLVLVAFVDVLPSNPLVASAVRASHRRVEKAMCMIACIAAFFAGWVL